MLAKIKIEGLGPHQSLNITFAEPMGSAEIIGASEVGKSTLIDSVTFVLWGCDRSGRPIDIRAMHDGSDEIAVRLELVNGAVMERTLRRAKGGGRGKTTRALRGRPMHTEKEWLGALAVLGANWPALRQILVPFAWRPLLRGAGGGRPLRDMLASVLPRADKLEIVKELLQESGHEWRRGDPAHESDAVEVRARANALRQRLTGDVDRLASRVAVAEAVASVVPGDMASARAIVAGGEQWAAYRGWEVRARERRSVVDSWARRRSALGARPGDASATSATTATAKRALDAARDRRVSLGVLAAGAKERAADLRVRPDAPIPSERAAGEVRRLRAAATAAASSAAEAEAICPTCAQPWAGAAEEARSRASCAQAAADAMAARVAANLSEAAEEHGQVLARREDAAGAADDRAAELAAELGEAAAAEEQAEAAYHSAHLASTEGADWDRAYRALGPEPSAYPTEIALSPPTMAAPSPDVLAQCRADVAAAVEARGAAAQRARDLDRLKQTRAISEASLAEAGCECHRLDALVDAVRRAPSEAARRQIGVLGDLGPVALDFTDSGGVDLSIDDRPWHLASTGRQLVADVWLRAGLRRAVRIPWLTIFIDCAQDVGGQPIPDAAPCVVLRTTDGPLMVRA